MSKKNIEYNELIFNVKQNMLNQGDKFYSTFSNTNQFKRRINEIMTIKNSKKQG